MTRPLPTLEQIRTAAESALAGVTDRETASRVARILSDSLVGAPEITKLKMAVPLLEGRRGYLALMRLVDAEPDKASHWLQLGIRARELGYVRKSQEALKRCLSLSEATSDEKHAARAEELLGLRPPSVTSEPAGRAIDASAHGCVLCKKASELGLPALNSGICLNCLDDVIEFVDRASRPTLSQVWKIAEHADAKVAMAQELVQLAAAVDGDLRTYEDYARSFLGMDDADAAFLMLLAVIRRNRKRPEIAAAVNMLFQPQLARPGAAATLVRLMGSHQ